jgi:hypothetical protein
MRDSCAFLLEMHKCQPLPDPTKRCVCVFARACDMCVCVCVCGIEVVFDFVYMYIYALHIYIYMHIYEPWARVNVGSLRTYSCMCGVVHIPACVE